jgi:hypothetical protein
LKIDCEPLYLKIDTQGYESQVLRGATRTLKRAIAVEVELTLAPLYEGQALAFEICSMLRRADFVPTQIAPGYSDPNTDEILQLDVIFGRSD